MSHFVECSFTPKEGGAKFEVKNVSQINWGISRTPGPNGHIGMRGHDIRIIELRRKKSLQDGGVARLEDETIQLAGATEQRAYFSGEITIARADDSADKVQTIRWERGWICELSTEIYDTEIEEKLSICVTGLKIDNTEFKRVQTV